MCEKSKNKQGWIRADDSPDLLYVQIEYKF